MKKCFVERKGDRIIIYPFSVLKEKLLLFKEEQINEIPKAKLFYKAVAYDKHSELISEGWRGNYTPESDSFLSDTIGFHQSASSIRMCENHSLFPVSNFVEMRKQIGDDKFYRANGLARLSYNEQAEALYHYTYGLINKKPFRVLSSGKKDKKCEYFLPTSSYVATVNYSYIYPIIHITRMAYLLELLQNDQMTLLKEATTEEFKELLKMFEFGESREFSLELVKSMSGYIRDVRHAYGAGLPSVHDDKELSTRSKADKPFIEEVKRIALK